MIVRILMLLLLPAMAQCQDYQGRYLITDTVIKGRTISNAVIKADKRRQIFNNCTLVNCRVDDGVFSALWFPTLQQSIDAVLANNATIQKLYIPGGTYTIDKPLRFSVGHFFSLDVYGDTPGIFGLDNFGTVIKANFRARSAIEIQLGKGCLFHHLEIVGIYNPPQLDDKAFYARDISAYDNNGCENTVTSVYSGITVDPDKVGYGGSTGCRFENLIIRKFISAMTFSPNGQTRNCEMMLIDGLQIENCKMGIISCHDQEKLNVVRNLGCWGDVHTVFAFGAYGAGAPGYWVVDGVNIAGKVNHLVSRKSAGYYPIHFFNVFAESLGSIGFIDGTMGDSFNNCVFDFKYLNEMGYMPDAAIGAAIFNNCSLRYYGTSIPVVFNGTFQFNNCQFEVAPVIHGGYDNQMDAIVSSSFNNCLVYHYILGGHSVSRVEESLFSYRYADGNTPFQLKNSGKRLIPGGWAKPNYPRPAGTVTISDKTVIDGEYPVNSAVTFIDMRDQYRGAGVVLHSGNGHSEIGYINLSVQRGGKYAAYVWMDLLMAGFTGTTRAGSPVISNVQVAYGNLKQMVGHLMKVGDDLFVIKSFDGKNIVTDKTWSSNGQVSFYNNDYRFAQEQGRQ